MAGNSFSAFNSVLIFSAFSASGGNCCQQLRRGQDWLS